MPSSLIKYTSRKALYQEAWRREGIYLGRVRPFLDQLKNMGYSSKDCYEASMRRWPVSVDEDTGIQTVLPEVKEVVEEMRAGAPDRQKPRDSAVSSRSSSPSEASGTPERAGKTLLALKELENRPRSASTKAIVDWVFENLPIAHEVMPEDCPSPGAWGLLQDLQMDRQFRQTFQTSVWLKSMPNQSQLEAAARFADDGRQVLGVLDKIEAAAQE